VLCILVAVGLLIWMQDRPQTMGLPPVAEWKNDRWTEGEERQEGRNLWETQRSILKIPAIWVLALSSAAIYVTRYAINSWGILYLQEAKGFSLMEAGGMLTANTITGILGALAYGFASDKLFNARRPPVNLIFGLLEIAGLLLIFFGPPDRPGVMLFAFLLYGFGLTGLVTALGGLFAVDIAPKKAAGAAMGFIGVFSYLAAATQDRISGYLIEQGTTLVDGVRLYDFSTVIWFWVGSSVVSLLLSATLWRVRLRD
jgi:OPA family sugar phosphate sensor protein UhpC-like MFS transporter